MKIILFGLAGTGTSSVGKMLANELNLEFKSTGNILREKAKELNLSLNDFEKLCENDSKYDLELDKMVERYSIENDNFIFESRLAWYFIKEGIKIKLISDEKVTYQRISRRESISYDEAKTQTIERQELVERRYSLIYPQIKFPPEDSNFDLVIDSTNLSVEENVKEILDFLRERKYI